MSRVGITVEGGLLAADLVERIAAGDTAIPGQQAKDFGIETARLSAEIQAAFSDIRAYWESFKRRREFSHTSPVTLTREAWVIPLLERLGYTLRFQRAGAQIGGQNYPLSHRAGDEENATPIHIVGWDQKLGERVSGQRSPHALVQEYLNRSDALWGIVTNGRELRLLRNSARSSRPSYIAVELETILDGNLYNEFALVFRLLHRSRLPEDGGDAHECLLENWYQQGIEEGGRVRDRLRDGVKAALEILGAGFLRHPASVDLWARLDDGRLTEGQLYRELLNLIYRLLFLMVAEERRLLFVPDTGTSARHEVYIRWYGIGRLRDRADHRPGEDGYGDLWQGLKQTFRLFREQTAAAELALSALNGELFALTASIDLEAAAIRNDDLLEAMRQLSTFEERSGRKKTGVRRRANYAGLDVEELGSIYESLLDYHPQVIRDPSGFALVAGSERKSTGSYYTPPELVRELIESALVPVMEARRDAAATRETKEKALLSLTICDPAAGSGHFLLAAARRVGRELAILRSGEAEPAPETYRTALRDVIRHCIYAVDKNPLAVDLCKVALWIEGHAPGLPLSFLDHRIRCGDSLVGVLDLDVLKAGVPDAAFKPLTGDDRGVCTELRKRNKREREAPLGIEEAALSLGDLARGFAELADMPDSTPDEVQRKSARYLALVEDDPRSRRLRRASDAWTAAFFASRGPDQTRTTPTTADVWNALVGRGDQGQRPALIEDLREGFHFFHWHLAFPEVFQRGGFDVMLGNPPWERIKLQEQEFFAVRDREIAGAPNKALREKLIQALFAADAGTAQRALGTAFNEAKRAAEAEALFVRNSDRFPLTARGDVNTYALFAETATCLIAAEGRLGVILPTGIATDDTTKEFFGNLVKQGRLASLFGFENEGFIFPAIHHSFRFCLCTISGKSEQIKAAEFVFFARKIQQIHEVDRRFVLSEDDICMANPNTLTCPTFHSRADADLTKKIYRRVPVFVLEEKGTGGNPWGVTFATMFHMSGDSDRFLTGAELKRKGATRDGQTWRTSDGLSWIGLYEAKMIHQYDHRWATYEAADADAHNTTEDEKKGAAFVVTPRYLVPLQAVRSWQHGHHWEHDWLFGWREITGAQVVRTVLIRLTPKPTIGGVAVETGCRHGRRRLAPRGSAISGFTARVPTPVS